MTTDVSGLTPQQWERRLEEAADDPEALAAVLGELEREMHQEKTWLHDNPEPGNLLDAVLSFFGQEDGDVELLGQRIKSELRLERHLEERYRSWLPGEDYLDVLFPYLKAFGDEVAPDPGGLQFPGFGKYKGVRRGSASSEIWVFYIADRFPGRDPANFHVTFRRETGELLIKRVYKKELPRIDGISTVGRAVLAEMIRELVPSLVDIRELEVDNAANQATRDALLRFTPSGDGVEFALRDDADPARTPLGHLMLKLVSELGMRPVASETGPFRVFLGRFGTLRIEMSVTA